MIKGYLSEKAVIQLGRSLPRGIVRFVEGMELADWRQDILGWMVTGHERAWGDPVELVRTFGPYVEIVTTRESSVLPEEGK